jgi:hypothetical protein
MEEQPIKRGRGRPRVRPIKEKVNRYTRQHSVYDAINILCINGSDTKTIMHFASKLYQKRGGNVATEYALINVTKHIVFALAEYGILKKIGEIFQFVKGRKSCQE